MNASPEKVQPAPRSTQQTNAVFEHLTRHRKWPNVPTSLILGIALGLVGINVIVVDWRLRDSTTYSTAFSEAAGLAGNIPFLIVIISPFIAAALTAVMTSRFASGEALAMLKLTNVSPRAIIQGLLLAALFRLRLLWAISFGVLIPLVPAGAFTLIEIRQSGVQSLTVTRPDEPSPFWLGIEILLIVASIAIALNWFAICTAISMALRRRNPAEALAVSLVAVLGSLIVLILCVGIEAYASVYSLAYTNPDTYLLVRVLIVLLVFVYPFGGIALLRLAQSRL